MKTTDGMKAGRWLREQLRRTEAPRDRAPRQNVNYPNRIVLAKSNLPRIEETAWPARDPRPQWSVSSRAFANRAV